MTIPDDAKLLAESVTFTPSGKVAPNRILKSAMTELICDWPEDNPDGQGKPNAQYLKVYQEWGKGQIGVIVAGNTPVDRRYPENKNNPVIDKTSSWDPVAAYAPVIKAAKAGGSLFIFQLTHAGRQTPNSVCEEPVSSSDVQTPPMGGKVFNKPRPMTIAEIEDLIDRFAFASKVLYDAGADGIQLHAAHGYLLSQFLSPSVNHRTDKYGGTPENRQRILFEIYDAIRARVNDPKFLLSIKINSADFSDGGFSEEESRDTVMKLEAAGVDLVELSGGTYESLAKTGGFTHLKDSTIKREAFFVEFADKIRPHLTTTKLAVTGGFRTVAGAAKAIREKSCDIIGLARPLTAEPDLPALFFTGKSIGAKENKVTSYLTTPSSNIQIVQLSLGKPLSDYSDAEVAAATDKEILGQ